MRIGFLGSLIALAAATGLGLAQSMSVPEPRKVELTSGNQGSPYAGPQQASSQGMAGSDAGCPAEGCPCCNGNGAGCSDTGPGRGDGKEDSSRYSFYARGEYLLWHIDDTHIPPLLANTLVGVASISTGGSTTTLPVLAQATFGAPGSSDVSFRDQSGGRFTAGYWFDDAHCFALEASGFFLSPRNIDVTSTTGTNLLTFPLSVMIPGTTGTPGTAAILTLAANAQLHATSFNEMWGAEVNGRSGKCWIGPVSFEGFGGLRYINLEEDFSSTESISLAGIPALTNFPLTPTPTGFTFFDAIHTRNQFYGAQLGATVDCCCGCFFLNATGKLGLGDMHQAVNLEGGALSLTPPATVTSGGLITSPADLGQHSRERCAFLYEGGVNFGYNFGSHFRAFVGYDVLFLSSVARPADQVQFSRTNLQVTVNNAPQSLNVITPGFQFAASTVLVQGCNFGLEFRY